MRKDSLNFIESAAYDLQTADAMLKSGRYVYVVFMCHLAIEKTLKAVVAEVTGTAPPRTHNLIYLLKSAGAELPADCFDFLAKINNASVVTRYPDDFKKLVEVYPKDVADDYLRQTRTVIECLRQDKRLAE